MSLPARPLPRHLLRLPEAVELGIIVGAMWASIVIYLGLDEHHRALPEAWEALLYLGGHALVPPVAIAVYWYGQFDPARPLVWVWKLAGAGLFGWLLFARDFEAAALSGLILLFITPLLRWSGGRLPKILVPIPVLILSGTIIAFIWPHIIYLTYYSWQVGLPVKSLAESAQDGFRLRPEIFFSVFVLCLAFLFAIWRRYWLTTWSSLSSLKRWVWVAVVLSVSFVLALPPQPNFHDQSYHNFVGPLQIVLSGGWPMVDSFSLYGNSYLALAPAAWIFPRSYEGLGFLVSIYDVICLIIPAFLVVLAAPRSRWSIVIAVILFAFLVLSRPYQTSLTPSVAALRFLPCWILILALASSRHPGHLGLGARLALAVNLVWAFETSLFGLVLVMMERLYTRRISGGTWRQSLIDCSNVVLTAGAMLFVLAVIVKIGSKEWPDISTNWEMIAAQTKGSNWGVPVIYRNGMIGFLAGCGIFAVALIIRSGLQTLAPSRSLIGSTPELLRRDRILLLLAASGIAMQMYAVGRSLPSLALITAPPILTIAAILAVGALDRARCGVGESRRLRAPRRMASVISAVTAAVAVAGMLGVALDRLGQPVGTIPGWRSNDVLLRACTVRGHCAPWNWVERWRQTFAIDSARMTQLMGGTWQNYLDFYQDTQGPIWALLGNAAMIYYYVDRPDAFGISDALTESVGAVSDRRRRAYAERAAQIPVGTPFIVMGKDYLLDLQQFLLEEVKKHVTLCLVRNSHEIWIAYKTRPLNQSCE